LQSFKFYCFNDHDEYKIKIKIKREREREREREKRGESGSKLEMCVSGCAIMMMCGRR